MNKLLWYWQELLLAAILLVALAELFLRAMWIGRFHPEIKTCPWSEVPRILWRSMTEDRVHLFELLALLRRRHPKGIEDHTRGSGISIVILAASLCMAVASRPTEALSPVAPPERLGPVWPIAETDIRTTILTRLAARLPEIKARLKESLAAYRVPATNRPTTETARTLYVDPSITLTADLVSHDGRVLAVSGQRINPLTVLPLRRTYLVVDGADLRQVEWTARQLERLRTRPAGVLLAHGSLEDARNALPPATRVFPAPPTLFAKLPIDTLPARVSRENDRIRIDFIAESEFAP